ncbi:MAG: hypothetical protein H0V01_15785 [Bacteroidetes bacterium]|nr:hypothetical protein [Bacteroidota bacterium]HET6244237.1 hypothetical protein [Bacteroidia bacterium]
MRKIICLTIFVCFVTLFACSKERNQTVKVVRDCTGTYLQFQGKDYHVCNLEKVSPFNDGDVVIATFKKIKVCRGSAMDEIVCLMYHPNEGWIEVEKIKP